LLFGTQNPTRSVLEKNLAALENGVDAVCFSSGLAAMDAILKLLKPGDEILASNDLYGGSYRLMKTVFEPYGIKSTLVDLDKPENIKKHLSKKTKLVWLETPTNPMLSIIDIKAICSIVKKYGNIMICVDNTFASGHSDVVMGAVVVKTKDLSKKLHYLQNAVGAIPGPQDCFLVLRGIKTLHIRVERACKNAKKIAKFLKAHPKVGKVYYPGFKNHPNHTIAKEQMNDFGGMISFDIQGGNEEDAMKILSTTHLFTLAESLGGVESLIGHPATMTHASIPKKERLKVGLTDSLIRLSVGIEDVKDLIDDLEVALRNV